MTEYSKESGLSANWQLQPPSMPSSVIMSSEAVRNIWYSLSESVTAGAITMESPVCMPTGSKFSIEQTVSTLPAPSRSTSNSISFQPPMYFSMSTWVMGESMSPLCAIIFSSSSSWATPPPAPPSVYAGRTMTG